MLVLFKELLTRQKMPTGFELFARSLVEQQVDTLFFIMGGPMHAAELELAAQGVRMVDVRHEQAAAMMAHAYSRVLQRPGVCMGCSGPGALNLHGGLANALIDGAPVVAFGGSSPLGQFGTGAFQEIDQVEVMRPVTKWAQRVYEARRIPEFVDMAFRKAVAGKPGPVYLDLPGDVLHENVETEAIVHAPFAGHMTYSRPQGNSTTVRDAVRVIAAAERPVLIYGSGVLWSQAARQLNAWIDRSGIPFYATPQARGAVPEDHEYSYPAARSLAFKSADVVVVVGTRLNYGLNHGKPPRFSETAKFIRIDIDAGEINGDQRTNMGIVGDARSVLEQMLAVADESILPERLAQWRQHLRDDDVAKSLQQEKDLNSNNVPIHPLRLCREIRDFLDRDAILVVDGQEILNYGRQSIPSFLPGHRLNSGTFGMMGVGMPFGVGAKLAKPDKQVLVLTGDGSFGMNLMELDTAVRHKVPLIVVVSLNGGWTADPKQTKIGRNLGYTRFDRIAQELGAHGELVEEPEMIRPALERAKDAVGNGKVALVNVITDWRARANAVRFTKHET